MAVLHRFPHLIPKLILLGLLGLASSAVNAQTPFGLNIAWTPNPELDVLGYHIYYGPRSRVYTNRVTVVGRQTSSARVEPLLAGATYHLAITAFNTEGVESFPSGEFVYSNRPPAITPISDQFLQEDRASDSLHFAVSDAETPASELKITARSSNPLLIPVNQILLDGSYTKRSLVIVPQLNQSGSAAVTLDVVDARGASNSVTFQVFVEPVNDKPVSWPNRDIELDEDTVSGSVPFYVLDVEDAPDDLWLLPIPSHDHILPYENMRLSGTGHRRALSFTPAPNAYGACVIWLHVFDLNGEFGWADFNVKVRSVNDPPNISAIDNLSLSEGSGPLTVQLSGINSGAANEVQPLVVSARSSNPGVVPNPKVNYTSPNGFGSLLITPAIGTNGSAVITVTVSDGEAINGAASRSFSVTVKAPDEPPVILGLRDSVEIRPPALSIRIGFQIQDPDTPADRLTVSGYSSDPSFLPSSNLVFEGTGEQRTLTITPLLGRIGPVTVTVVVSDGNASVSASFYLFVAALGG
jgi:hypothetical protein